MRQAKFSIGQIVHHRLFDYRGVIFDVDGEFTGSEQWYQTVALSRPPRDQPWYRVLVDSASHETYVAERNLEASTDLGPIRHPMVDSHFSGIRQGVYLPLHLRN